MATRETQVNVKNVTYKCSNSALPICFQFYYDATYKLHPKLALLVLETTHKPTQYQSVCLETLYTPSEAGRDRETEQYYPSSPDMAQSGYKCKKITSTKP